jgi:hypothetical protein
MPVSSTSTLADTARGGDRAFQGEELMTEQQDQRARERGDARDDRRDDEAAAPVAAPAVARVREDDLEPHDGLRYVAKLFKALALLLIFMLIAELIIGFQQDGLAALGTLLVEATRLIVFAGFLWGAGDMAILLIESNHDLRAARILLGRLNGKMDRFTDGSTPTDLPPPARPPTAARPRNDRTRRS